MNKFSRVVLLVALIAGSAVSAAADTTQGAVSIANHFILPIPAQDVTGQPVTPKLRVAQTHYGSLGQKGAGECYLTNGVELVEGRDYTVAVELCRGDLNLLTSRCG